MWYAIACTSQFEDKIANKIGPAAYVPKRTVWRKARKYQISKSGRIKKQWPLIPGYVLVDIGLGDSIYSLLCRDRNVYGFVASAGVPLKIKDSEIEFLKARENAGHYDETKEILHKLIGGRFDISDGALDGKRIKIAGIKNRDLLIEVDGSALPVVVSIASFEKTKYTRVSG